MIYDALAFHNQTKKFEEYLILQSIIKTDCKGRLQQALSQRLDTQYKAGNSLMDILKEIRKN